MRELSEKIRQSAAADADSRELWDGALHRLIAQSAGNAFFLGIFDVINRVRQSDVWQSVREATRSDADMSVSFAQHAAIIDAIEARDVAGAGEAMLPASAFHPGKPDPADVDDVRQPAWRQLRGQRGAPTSISTTRRVQPRTPSRIFHPFETKVRTEL